MGRYHRLIIEIYGTLWQTRLTLWFVPFARWKPWMHNDETAALSDSALVMSEVRQMASFVARSSRFVPRASCLTQAITLRRVLGRRDQASELRLGVYAQADEPVQAHAWVMVARQNVLGGRMNAPYYHLLQAQTQKPAP